MKGLTSLPLLLGLGLALGCGPNGRSIDKSNLDATTERDSLQAIDSAISRRDVLTASDVSADTLQKEDGSSPTDSGGRCGPNDECPRFGATRILRVCASGRLIREDEEACNQSCQWEATGARVIVETCDSDHFCEVVDMSAVCSPDNR